jgi:hypothetical protein
MRLALLDDQITFRIGEKLLDDGDLGRRTEAPNKQFSTSGDGNCHFIT